MLTDLKNQVAVSIRADTERLERIADRLGKCPELGFKEHRTAALVAEELGALDLKVETGLALTGVSGLLDSGEEGPTVAVLGELDALPLEEHPDADPHTGAVHACGHNAQLTHLLAVARALNSSMNGLCGRILFLAAPAEEYVDLEYRAGLVDRGELEFMAGKPELIARGVFDEVDFALMVHATGRSEDGPIAIRSGMNGLLAKRARFHGRASHAGMAPHLGVNALNAANLALHAIHLQRETFRDEDHVRVHPIFTKAGDTVNVVPASAEVELYVRAANRDALLAAADKVDRSLRAGALAVGADLTLTNLGGYLPLVPHSPLDDLFAENAGLIVGNDRVGRLGPVAGSTDAGDLSHLLPVLHAFHGGCEGMNHGADFRIADPLTALVDPAVVLAWTVIDLLRDGAERAKHVLDSFEPQLTKSEYLRLTRSMSETAEFSER